MKIWSGMRFLTVIIVIAFSPLLDAMSKQSLHMIERELILREIKKHGLSCIKNKIHNSALPQRIDQIDQRGKISWFYSLPTILEIDAQFYKRQRRFDPLAKTLFHMIEQIESKLGYVPEQIITKHKKRTKVMTATNIFGDNSRYYWV